MFERALNDGVLQLHRPDTNWLSTAWDGGYVTADAAYNITVPNGWEQTDLDSYVATRLDRAGFESEGPTLLTGVDQAHARGARAGRTVAFATCGLSNPSSLPMNPDDSMDGDEQPADVGTVNIVVCTDRSLDDGGLATLLIAAVEAKTATLLARTGFTGTTTDAVVVGCDPTGERVSFSGSATAVGAEARACVREAIRASLRSRYPDGGIPPSVEAAEHGAVTNRRATTFKP